MCRAILHLLILWTSISQASSENEVKVAPLCPRDQRAFGGSCFAFVNQQQSFHAAQDWCEKSGGHLAFIPDKNTQNFFEKHLDPDKDVWLGMAPSTSTPNRQHVGGALSWLDGSPVTYSKWLRSPQPGASCGHILRSSSFQWEATSDCHREMNFLCQYESGRKIVCAGHDTSLECSSKQVLMIDSSFYGRESIHYCRSAVSAPASLQKDCGWVDVKETITARCHGRRTCNITKVMSLLDELCPQLGSYLSVEYHCSDGLSLSVKNVAAVLEDVVIEVKLLTNVQDLLCMLQTGDGQTISFRPPEGLRSSVTHKYTNPRTFVVKCECSSSSGQMHFTAHKMVTIQEPVREIGAIRCYARKKSFSETKCTALRGEAFQIQMEVKAGTNVAYRIQIGEQFLAGLSVFQGNVPKNISVMADTVKQLGSGCHRLTIYASNKVTTPEVSSDLQVCVLEKISGLQASILEDTVDPFSAHRVAVGVSLKHGAPVYLSFQMKGEHSSLVETRRMDVKRGKFFFQCPDKECVQIKIRAWNAFSSQKVDSLSSFNEKQVTDSKEKRLVRDSRSVVEIFASPASVTSTSDSITLSLSDATILSGLSRFEWNCKGSCNCKDKYTGIKNPAIKGNCLEPFHFDKYSLDLKGGGSTKPNIKDVCITLTPTRYNGNDIRFTCTDGCTVQGKIEDANIELSCDSSCPKVDWYIQETDDESKWDADTKDCYISAKRIPLVEKDSRKTSYKVKKQRISDAKSRNQNVTVVIIFGEPAPQYLEYILNTTSSSSSSSSSSSPSSSSSSSSSPSSSSSSSSPSSSSSSSLPSSSSSSSSPSSSSSSSSPSSSSSSPSSSSSSSSPSSSSSSSSPSSSSSSSSPSSSSSSSPLPPSPFPSSSSSSSSPSPTQTYQTTEGTPTNVELLSCVATPSTGTILDAFNLTCTTQQPCVGCQFCFTADYKQLRCSESKEVQTVFLPLGNISSNYRLLITVTVANGSESLNTTFTVQVLDFTPKPNSTDDLRAAVVNTLEELQKNGQLSGETVGQIFSSVAESLNNKPDASKLREEMLDTMVNIINEAPPSTPKDAQALAEGLTALAQERAELRVSAQISASSLFETLSLSLMNMNVSRTEDGRNQVLAAASTIVDGIDTMLNYSFMKNVSDALLSALSNIQSALLKLKEPNEGPTLLKTVLIRVLVNRVTPDSLLAQNLSFDESFQPNFTLPELPTDLLPSEGPVDIRMLSLAKNPFSWNEKGNISGLIGSLSLSTEDGSGIPVENLSEDIEILLPRPAGEQVNTTVLDLVNYSTTIIDVPSADTSLLIKMVPSLDPLPFKVYLGFINYPTETNYVAMTQMPLQGTTEEEKYTWIVRPEELKGNTGAHYLVVRPIVGPGIKSVNASLSVTPIASSCRFWDESILQWSMTGCKVGVKTTSMVTQCLCNHLTFFGSSFFVTPNLVDPSQTAQLFATFAENPVVVCFVGALFVTYLLVVVWARRKDIQDTAKVKVTVLHDNNPKDEYRYLLCVRTGHRIGASTSSQVIATLLGVEGNSEPHHLTDQRKPLFERGAVDMFLITTPSFLGELQGIRLWHDNSGSHPAWYVANIMVQDLQTEQKWNFLCNSWLALDVGDCCIDRIFPVSTEEELKSFSNLFFMKTTRDFCDGHLWYSVVSRPAGSNFTCVQRVSCCFSLLLCTMLTSIMFYGIPTDPSEQVMDLGHFEFTWQQFMIGVQSSLIMFPINVLIVSIFRNTRPRESSCCGGRKKKPKSIQKDGTLETVSSQVDTKASLDIITKDVTRLADLLCKTAKSNIPGMESRFGPEEETEINTIVSEMEDFIQERRKIGDNGLFHLPECCAHMNPPSAVEATEKKSNKMQHLHRKLCDIEKELSLLGPSSFQKPNSYSQALKQVQDMKGLIEGQLFPPSHAKGDEPTHKKFRPADGAASDGGGKKSLCCHGMLPWWFVFVGWLLVIATSVVSGYFTMLYGLKFGKQRSISWLVSMIISFFQSLLFIQPLKVICLAVFFSLIIRKVEEEDLHNVEFVEEIQGESKDHDASGWKSLLYEPPPPAAIERMKRNKIMQQKANALLKEILIYIGFLWMLLLVAYGQRDPNAFYLNQHIRNSFTGEASDSMSLQDVFTWANTTLLTNLFGEYPGFITDGNSKLVGNARVRQVRVKEDSCQIAGLMLPLVPECNAPYSWDLEEMGSYETGWNHSGRENFSASTPSPWKYQTQTQLRGRLFWGKTALYRGGGFVVELGPDLSNASSTLEYLFENKWLDMYTRAIFVEFTVYNANVNLFCIITLLMETTAVGVFQFHSELQSIRLYQSTGGLYVFVMAAEIIYLLFILYYMFLQAKLMRLQRWDYFRNKLNLLELSIILLSMSAVAIFIRRTLLGNRDVAYYQTHRDQFASFYDTATADLQLQYLIAFLVLLATVKCWHLLRLNPKMNLMTAALQRAWNDISGFLLIFGVLFVAYSITSNLIYGWKLSSYKTFTDSLLTVISLQAGIFNYDEVLNEDPVLGGLLVGSCIVFMTFVLLNLLISLVLVALNTEQLNHKPSEEEEVVDLLLSNIFSLIGFRYKDKKDTATDSSCLALNNTTDSSKSH